MRGPKRAREHSQVDSVADAAAAPITIRRRRRALMGGFLLAVLALWTAVPLGGLSLGTSAATPDLDGPGRAPGLLLVRGEAPASEQRTEEDRQAPFGAVNEVLAKAIAAATEMRKELQSLKRDNNRLVAELAQANTRRIELERSNELAEARIAELTNTLRRDAARLAEELTRLHGQNRQLNQSLARADATRKAAVAEAEKALAEMAKKLAAATQAAAQSRADLDGLYKELEAKDQELEAKDQELAAAAPSLSALAQPSVPETASKTDAGQSVDSPRERSQTELSMAGPTTAPAEAESRLADLRASIKVFNDLQLRTAGVNLFSGIASVNGRTVDVGAAAAWDTLPAVGKQSYLDSLLDLWLAQGGEGPAAVRIVDPSGRVLAEKSWP
jgi:hypothetical protein